MSRNKATKGKFSLDKSFLNMIAESNFLKKDYMD